MNDPNWMIYLGSVMALSFALIVLISGNPIVSAIALMGTLFSTACLYFGLGNYFLGVVQILVYAGAVAVLFAFIIMLLDLKPAKLRMIPGRKPFVIAATVGAFALGLLLLCGLGLGSLTENIGGSIAAADVAKFFISRHQIAFQAAGLLIFGAILGAITLARGHLLPGKESESYK